MFLPPNPQFAPLSSESSGSTPPKGDNVSEGTKSAKKIDGQTWFAIILLVGILAFVIYAIASICIDLYNLYVILE